MGILDRFGLSYRIDDRRRMLPEVNFTFTGKLRPYQQEAVDVILARDFGTLSAPTGSGKTARVIDYVDSRCGVLDNAARHRAKIYQDSAWKLVDTGDQGG